MSIRTERRGPVLLVTIDRPEAANALSLAMSDALVDAWCELRDDDALRVAVLTGAGDRSFCAGADLKEVGDWYASMSPEERRRRAATEPGLAASPATSTPASPSSPRSTATAWAAGSSSPWPATCGWRRPTPRLGSPRCAGA